jgi:6-pyruvoyltetrahydropterin/6-carboxytetrahydropterin synthase
VSFEVGVVARFTASHHLVGDFGPASQPHTHDYHIDATVEGNTLRADGTLFDITDLQTALGAVVADLDGRNLNQVPELSEPNSTAEVVARFVFSRVAPSLSGRGLTRLVVRVWESAEAYASYSDELA